MLILDYLIGRIIRTIVYIRLDYKIYKLKRQNKKYLPPKMTTKRIDKLLNKLKRPK